MSEPSPEPENLSPWLSASLRTLFSRESLILLGVLVLVLAHRQIGALTPPRFWPLPAGYWFFLTAVVAFLIIPSLAILVFLHGRFDEFGFRFGRSKEWSVAILALYVVVFPFLRYAAEEPQFRAFYPLFPPARNGGLELVNFETLYGFYFFSWEFLFRGFLLFGLARKLGALAIPVQAVPFAMAHIGKPYPELYASIIAGLALGTLALRTRSMLPCFLLHWACALTLDLLIVYT